MGPLYFQLPGLGLESRALHVQAPKEKELDLMVPCCNFLLLLCRLPDAESVFEFMSQAVQKEEFKELFRSYH